MLDVIIASTYEGFSGDRFASQGTFGNVWRPL